MIGRGHFATALRTALQALCACALTLPQAGAANPYELMESLSERSKWKSFGVENWTEFNPLERALPSQRTVAQSDWTRPRNLSSVGQLKALIAFAEAGPRGYDAVHVSARIKPPARPTSMTLGQVKAWIQRTPGQPHAIGRYQFIPSTLVSLQRRAGLSDNAPFGTQVQDVFADLLLADAGLSLFLSGRMSERKFMNNLARIWAGLPLHTGKSAYHGYAGNRATISLAFFRTEMQKIFGG